ncbi:MAG: nucleotidyltransferase [Cellulosilyticaceae bacterium]
MHVTGIVAEYNPFHNGHLYQLTQTKKLAGCDKIIAVMSGNFAQRGNPCIVDKYTRTQMALKCGVDMVLELPFPFATASAERFAEAAISVFHKSGIVNSLCFGSEIDDITLMQEIAHTLVHESPELSSLIKTYLNTGTSYPKSRELALIDYLRKQGTSSHAHLESLLNNPNNILGIEYIKALIKYQSSIKPITIKRKTSHYHDTSIHASIASATAIRNQFKSSNIEDIECTMPSHSFDLLLQNANTSPSLDNFSMILHHKLIFSTLDDLYSLWDIPKNLCHSIYNAYLKHLKASDIIDEVTSKTYSRATVHRAILKILLDVKQNDLDSLEKLDWIPYIRVLGCKKDSLPLLSALSKASTVPVITNLGKVYNKLSPEAKCLIDYEIHATNLYYLGKELPSFYNQDFSQSFLVID